jgi:uncharacterized protein (DUF2237 family)
MSDEANKDLNVLGQGLELCGLNPRTGFRRTGACSSGQQDVGRHLLCARVTREFLEFSRARGNDLISPVPAYQFPGLKPGDHWCLCIDRWLEALEEDVAPPVILAATHKAVLQTVDLEVLQRYAAQINT